jgi:hypothetical protein
MPFVVPLLVLWRVGVEAKAVDAIVQQFHHQVKCRGIMQRSLSIQTDA